MLKNLLLRRLVPPFERNRINGRLLSQVESIEDLIDFDKEEVKPVFARTLFKELAVWKNNGNRVPKKLLVARQKTATCLEVVVFISRIYIL